MEMHQLRYMVAVARKGNFPGALISLGPVLGPASDERRLKRVIGNSPQWGHHLLRHAESGRHAPRGGQV
jgi:hypothetical protein